MMDRQKKDQLPQMQADFIKNVCLPLYEVIFTVTIATPSNHYRRWISTVVHCLH